MRAPWQQAYRFSGFVLDPRRGLMRGDGTDVQLRTKSLELLAFLISRAGQIVSKDELLEHVWEGMAVSEDSLTQCVHDVRRALADSEQDLIRTVPRRGYLFAGQVLAEMDSGHAAPASAPINLDRPSLAVLPFLNLNGDLTQDFFADGMAEEIITGLTRIKWLFVIARNSRFSYKGRSVDAEAGVHLWAERFDATLEDIFDLQDQITEKVVGAIAPKLELAEIDRVQRKATDSLQAHDYYLRALAVFYRISRTGNDEALANINRAIELDPHYATAYGFAARIYVQRNSGAWIEDFDREVGEAERLARRAVKLGQDDAVALSPSLASAWLCSGWIRCAIGDTETALRHIECARRLSPNDPQGFSLLCCEGIAHFTVGNYVKALGLAEAAMQVKSDYIIAHCLAMTSAANAGDLVAAEVALKRALRIMPELSLTFVSRVQVFYIYGGPITETWLSRMRKAGLRD